ncbi:GNAT family N-acetyltransferase [Halobacillus litoralis]|uniref:GNAT family N-acetyltransferase n=1 Tax=Halobacillus litoralis TaxID=45668 RepID=A0A845FAP8_9BACI|nr:GNAT family N-acetyltransferase [Halobacillus litoralis]MYL71472.1 GNAT family N-acetyltransferase [Halobacillus litoralis]
MTPKKCVIRKGKPEDAPHTMALAKEMLAEGYGLKHLSEFHDSLEKEKSWISRYEDPEFFLVAEMEDEVVGFLNFDLGALSSTRHQGTFGVNVKRDARNKGIGRELVKAMTARCLRIEGIDIIRLHVMESNARAIHLYEDLGFQKEGRFKDYIRKNGRSENLIHMALHLRSK